MKRHRVLSEGLGGRAREQRHATLFELSVLSGLALLQKGGRDQAPGPQQDLTARAFRALSGLGAPFFRAQGHEKRQAAQARFTLLIPLLARSAGESGAAGPTFA